jgi:hypothetical protein
MSDLEEWLRDNLSGSFDEWHSLGCPVWDGGPDNFIAKVER